MNVKSNFACSVPGCMKDAHARQLCPMHYQRWRIVGSVGDAKERKGKSGMGSIDKDGYQLFRVDGRRKLAHVAIAEKALGKPLPAGAEIHHVNEVRNDNRPENLVICQSKAYHKLLHARANALDACGKASWRKCHVCKIFDSPGTLFVGRKIYHRACNAAKELERRDRRG